MRFGPNVAGSWEKASEKEWLLTNGRGGYGGGIISGANTRRYHGLLISSPPQGGERHLYVSKLHEELTVGGHTYYLASNELGDCQQQNGQMHLVEFSMEPHPTFIYRCEDVYLIKELFMVHGEATTIAKYKLESSRVCKLRIYPLVNNRNHHTVNNTPSWPYEKKLTGARVDVIPPDGPVVTLDSTAGNFNELFAWFYNMSYEIGRASCRERV